MSAAETPTDNDPTPETESAAAEPVSTAAEVTPDVLVPRRSRPSRRLVYRASLVGVCLAIAGLGWPLWQQHRVAAAGSAGERAAVQFAEILTSIDSDKVDDDFNTVLNGATGEFKDTYTKASVQLRQLLIDNKATGVGAVVESAVQSGSTDTVVVLLMVNQTVTNTTRPDSRVDRSRMKMTMQKVGGRWLASKVELP